jgi:hypothetical protein
LKDGSEIKASWYSSFDAVVDRFTHMATKYETSLNDTVGMKAVLEWRRELAGSEMPPVLLILYGVCGSGETHLSPIFGRVDLFFLEEASVTTSCICSKCR